MNHSLPPRSILARLRQASSNQLVLFLAAMAFFELALLSHLVPGVVHSVSVGPIIGAGQFSQAADGSWETTGLNRNGKHLVQVLALAKNTEYRIRFDLKHISGSGLVVVDFAGTQYDNPEQEFHINLSDSDSLLHIDRSVNSGNPPADARLRIFAYDPVQFAVRNVEVTQKGNALIREVFFALASLSAFLLVIRNLSAITPRLVAGVTWVHEKLLAGFRRIHPAWMLTVAALLWGASTIIGELSLTMMVPAPASPISAGENFKALDKDTYAVTGMNSQMKMLNKSIAFQKYTDYLVSFSLPHVSGQGMVVVDFVGPKYDNPQQEFHLHLNPADAGRQISRVVNSGDAPAAGILRVFSEEPVQFTVRDLRLSIVPAGWLAAKYTVFRLGLLCLVLALLKPLASLWERLAVLIEPANQRLRNNPTTGFAGLNIPAVLVLALGVWGVASMALLIHRNYFSIPWGDAWDTWNLFLTSGKRYSPEMLFTTHVDHRILVPRLFFMIDHYYFAGRSAFLLICSFLLQMAHAVLIWRLGVRAGIRSWWSMLAGGAVLAFLFSAQQFSNLTWGFQISFICVYVFSTLALVAVAKAESARQRMGWIALACLAGMAATYSMGNGMAIWGILVVLCMVLGLPHRWTAVVLSCGVFNIVVYLRDFHSGSGANPIQALGDLPQLLEFASVFLGAPVGPLITALLTRLSLPPETLYDATLVLPGVVGAAGALVTVSLWVGSIRRRDLNSWQLVLLYDCLFIIATSLIVALGRSTNYGVSDAMVSRYTTPSCLFWALLLVLLYSRRQECLSVRPVQAMILNGSVAALIFGAIAIRQFSYSPELEKWTRGITLGEMAIASDVYDKEAWLGVFHTPPGLFGLIDYLRANRLSIFAEAWTGWMGKPVNGVFQVLPAGSCLGRFDAATAVVSDRPGWRVSGWAWDTAVHKPIEAIVVTDGSGVIVGNARTIADRPEVASANPELKSPHVGWSGFAHGSGEQTLSAFAVRGDGKTSCLIGSLKVTVK